MLLPFRAHAIRILMISITLLAVFALRPAAAAEGDIPAWLNPYVGEGDGQIAPVVLARARALYLKKQADSTVKNPCYFAMDATRPSDLGGGNLGRRFYVICEAEQSFRAIPVGHGAGRNLKGVVNFSNGRACVKNFGNALDSNLTTGGNYVTSETKTSFKGYYRVSVKEDVVFQRSFIQFDGEGDTADARKREIGGHASALLRGVCLRKKPASPYADKDGFVPFGKMVDYSGGRSNGCTSWSPSDAREIIPMMKDNPTTLYIYPEASDIAAVAAAAAKGEALAKSGTYWNPSCLKDIGAPKFWSNKALGPLIAQFEADHPQAPPQPPPLCKGP